ncbi:MAG TPA: adenylate/guanylate cyclase domain-containing protein [Flavobacteriales bacterium]|nr:adenylate/guanylate cyclase domain-containing protein [Flavobacteriales bacterium]
MLHRTVLWRHKADRIITFALVTLVVALLLNLYARVDFHTLQLLWALFGLLIGTAEQFFFTGRVAQAPVWVQLLLRIALIPLIALSLVSALLVLGVVPVVFEQAGITTVGQLWTTRTGLVVNSLIVATAVILFMEMERMVGTRTFRRFLTGRYVHPKRERIIVMFMDLADSTMWTEKLGDTRYYAMLNETFGRMAAPVLRSDAEILKYIGDEVIFTWSVPRGARDARCLDLYFDFHEAINHDRDHYQRTYGMVPRFRAGIHCGEVITSQVGTIKRMIDHSGDAMNTCARMVGAAKMLDTGMVVSEDLLAAMTVPERFKLGPSTPVELRGKVLSVAVRPVTR